MTLRPRAVRAAIAARTRIRDIAAAASAHAQAADAEARAAAESAGRALDHAIDRAHSRLAASGSVAELDRIAGELEGDRASAADAEQVRRDAAAARERALNVLQQRERQLRTVERALDMLLDERAAGAARSEQRLTDDLGSRRRDA